jgi:parallel beta-helix repeat protein
MKTRLLLLVLAFFSTLPPSPRSRRATGVAGNPPAFAPQSRDYRRGRQISRLCRSLLVTRLPRRSRAKAGHWSLATVCALLISAANLFAQGSLAPPGAPAPTMKTLQQIEPCTPISSLPFTINASGSYYLTSNLTQSGSAAGITISADNVTVDLGGFALIGVLSGTAAGVAVPVAHKNVEIRNGTIRNWNGGGVAASLATNSVYRDLRLSDNFDNGLFTGSGALVVDCVADNNIVGLSVGAGSTIRSCTVSNNLSDGISTGGGCTITGCTARGNNGNGILASAGCTVVACTAIGNIAGNGIQAGAQSVVKDSASSGNNGAGIKVSGDRSIVESCSADSNGGMGIVAAGNGTGTVIRKCSAADNLSDGINAYRNCLIIDNLSTGNGNGGPFAAGIHVTSFGNRIEGNVVSTNDTGILIDQSGTANLVFRNTATGNTKQFDILANNKVATIITPADSAAISGSSGGTAFGDAWSNISH